MSEKTDNNEEAAVVDRITVDTPYRQRMKGLILAAGGEIEDNLFVTKPGVKMIAETEFSRAENLWSIFSSLKCNSDIFNGQGTAYLGLAEFNAKLADLNSKESNIHEFLETMADEFGHLSVFQMTQVSFFIAGISMETSMELVAHSEAEIGRLTSSKTQAMLGPFYRIWGTPEEREIQKRLIIAAQVARFRVSQSFVFGKFDNSVEWYNINNLGSKATALTFTMKLKDFHKFFTGRLSRHGNEQEVQEVCRLMCETLHRCYPVVIQPPEHYEALGEPQQGE